MTIPPAVLLLIYSVLGGLALFMYLMGMSTVLTLELFFFNEYFNYRGGPPAPEADPFLEELRRSSFSQEASLVVGP